jgi:Arc/MetJ-type ribon-helix-helix transcriptional regulator
VERLIESRMYQNRSAAIRYARRLLHQSSTKIRSSSDLLEYALSTAELDTHQLSDLKTAVLEIEEHIKGLTSKQKRHVLTLALALHLAGVTPRHHAGGNGRVLKGGVATQRSLGQPYESGELLPKVVDLMRT